MFYIFSVYFFIYTCTVSTVPEVSSVELQHIVDWTILPQITCVNYVRPVGSASVHEVKDPRFASWSEHFHSFGFKMKFSAKISSNYDWEENYFIITYSWLMEFISLKLACSFVCWAASYCRLDVIAAGYLGELCPASG